MTDDRRRLRSAERSGLELRRRQFQASEEATIVLLTESQNPEYSTTIGALFGNATGDVFGTHEDIDTTDQLLVRAEDIGADIMTGVLNQLKHQFLPNWWADILTGIVSTHVNPTAQAA